MAKLRFYILLLLGVLVSISGNAQYFKPKGSIYVETTIPTNEKNLAFQNTMEGLFHGGIGYQHSIWKGLTLGAGVNYSFFKINQFSLGQSIGNGGMHIPAVHLKIGYEKFTTERVSFYGGIRGGMSSIHVVNDSCEANLGGPYQTYTPFVEALFELTILTESGSQDAFNLSLGYSLYFKEYNADFLCRETLTGLIPEASDGIIRFLSIGFGYRYYFDK